MLRQDVVPVHEVEELPWHFLERLLGQLPWIVLELAEGHELDDVAGHVLLESLRVQWRVVGVQNVHGLEVGVADANDDN